MKGAIFLLLAAVCVCYTTSSVINVRTPTITGPMFPPQKIGMCSYQACVTDTSTCFCIPSIIGVPQTKCNRSKNPRKDLFPKCTDVWFG